MKAVRIHAHGDPDVLTFEEVARPQTTEGHVLVEVKACALNHLDIWVRNGKRGRHPIDVELPRILGSDVAGVIQEVGGNGAATGPDVGTRVALAPGKGCGKCRWCLQGKDNNCDNYDAIGVSQDGGYAEWIVVPTEDVVPIPDHLDFVQAASIPLAYLTAWHMLVTKGQVRAGEDVLIHAAGSGVGSAALLIAKLLGARVFVTASTDNKLNRARVVGADVCINYSEPGLVEKVQRLTDGKGADMVIDSVGAAVFEESINALAVGGRMVTCGATAGADVHIDLHRLQEKRATLFCTVMGTRGDLLDVFQAIAVNKVEPIVDSVFPLRDAALAHQRIEDRMNFGKVVLVNEEGAGNG